MAQEKEVKEKPKRTRKTQKSAKEKPYVEQINELLFVHNKNDPQTGVQAVSGIDEKGKVQTVPAVRVRLSRHRSFPVPPSSPCFHCNGSVEPAAPASATFVPVAVLFPVGFVFLP